MNNNLNAQIIEEAAVIDSSHGDALSHEDHGFDALEAVNDEKMQEAPKKARGRAKNIGLFFASPFIALGYAFALPLVGMYMFAKLAREAWSQNSSARA